ncbi:hypothetical protein Tco_0790814 [Tanacetum coccineum]
MGAVGREICYHLRKANVVADALGEASKVENVTAEMLLGLDQLMERKEDGGMYFIWVSLIGDVRTLIMDEAHASSYTKRLQDEKLARLYIEDRYVAGQGVLVNHISLDGRFIQGYHSSIRCALFEALYGRKYRSPVLWAKIRESMLIGPGLVQETTDKVVLIKENLKVASVALERCSAFGKKDMLASRYVGPLEIIERDSVIAYWIKMSDTLCSVLIVSNLKKCLTDANLHVHLEEIKVDKTLCFVEEPVEIIDSEVKSLKRSRILIVKVHWNSKRGYEDFIKTKYPHLLVEQAIIGSTK